MDVKLSVNDSVIRVLARFLLRCLSRKRRWLPTIQLCGRPLNPVPHSAFTRSPGLCALRTASANVPQPLAIDDV